MREVISTNSAFTIRTGQIFNYEFGAHSDCSRNTFEIRSATKCAVVHTKIATGNGWNIFVHFESVSARHQPLRAHNLFTREQTDSSGQERRGEGTSSAVDRGARRLSFVALCSVMNRRIRKKRQQYYCHEPRSESVQFSAAQGPAATFSWRSTMDKKKKKNRRFRGKGFPLQVCRSQNARVAESETSAHLHKKKKNSKRNQTNFARSFAFERKTSIRGVCFNDRLFTFKKKKTRERTNDFLVGTL